MSPVMQATITIGIAAFLLFAVLGIMFPTPKESRKK